MSAALAVAQRVSMLHVAADVPAQERQPLQERPDPDLHIRIVRGGGQEDADALHLPALLRARGKRWRKRSRCGTNQPEEFAAIAVGVIIRESG